MLTEGLLLHLLIRIFTEEVPQVVIYMYAISFVVHFLSICLDFYRWNKGESHADGKITLWTILLNPVVRIIVGVVIYGFYINGAVLLILVVIGAVHESFRSESIAEYVANTDWHKLQEYNKLYDEAKYIQDYTARDNSFVTNDMLQHPEKYDTSAISSHVYELQRERAHRRAIGEEE